MARDKEAKLYRTKAPSGAQMRESLQGQLPAIKAKVQARIAKVKTGRPTLYTEELGEELCSRMGEGQSLTEACDSLGIGRSTALGWAEKSPEFASRLTRAREALAEHAFSEAYAIPRKLLAMYEKEPNLKLDPARVQVARLASDTLRWYSERLKPGAFAERKQEPASLVVNNNSLTINSRDLSQEQRDALRGALMAAKSLPPMIDGD